ncbi:MAG: B12-binding domain-containing radical SAM protein [Acidimicrobiales bacterium]|nr:B12-binding domain-containing radical SAM protein [Acidimicrobiales bacterium]
MRERPLLHLVNPRLEGPGIHHTFFHRFAPMALLVLSAVARRAGWDTLVIDENHEPIPDERPDLVAITVWTPVAVRAYDLADRYRARGIPVVVGGVHASLLPAEAALHADAVVAGEADVVFADVLADAAAGRLQPMYHGSWQGMDVVPRVDAYAHSYEQIPFSRYKPGHSMQTTRGCRFNCEFCSVIRINGRGQRHMEPERVVEELRFRTRMPPRMPGWTWFYLLDDDLAADLDYAAALFEALADAKLHMRFGAQASIGLARHPELVRLASRAGCRQLFAGFESISREALIECNKKNRPSEFAELIRTIHDAGIYMEGGFIFGFDHDTPDVFAETAEFVDRIGVDVAHFSILTPLPGTHTFARYYEQGRIVDFDWGHYNFYYPVFEPAQMTRQQLIDGQRLAFEQFYRRSWRARRFITRLGQRSPDWSLIAGYVGHSFAKEFCRDLQIVDRPAYEPPPGVLEQLLRTSRAEPNDAVATAVAQQRATVDVAMPTRLAPTSGVPTPVAGA